MERQKNCFSYKIFLCILKHSFKSYDSFSFSHLNITISINCINQTKSFHDLIYNNRDVSGSLYFKKIWGLKNHFWEDNIIKLITSIHEFYNEKYFLQGYLREGKSYLALGDYKSALRQFQKIKEIEPTNTSADTDIQSSNEVRQLNEMSVTAYASGDYRKVSLYI